MTLDFVSIYKECAGQPWSMFDNDPDSVDDFESSMKISINKAISTLWNLHPWSFRKKTKTIRTRNKVYSYNVPNGIVYSKVVNGSIRYFVKYNEKFLQYVDNFEDLELEVGTPTGFFIDDEKIYLNAIPENSGELKVTYLLNPFALDEEGLTNKYELEEDGDYINIPTKYESMFKNCLISLAMMYAIAEESDENYSAYQKQYDDSLGVLLKYALGNIRQRKITW